MHTAKTRLAIAGRIAAGMMANPQNYTSRDHETAVSLGAWNIAGKLCRLAEQMEADNAPEAIAERAAQYAKKYMAKGAA